MLAEDDPERSGRALALDPQFQAARTNNGDAFHELKRLEEALVAYNQALALDPQYAGAWNGKAIALWALGRVAEAEEADQRAKELGG